MLQRNTSTHTPVKTFICRFGHFVTFTGNHLWYSMFLLHHNVVLSLSLSLWNVIRVKVEMTFSYLGFLRLYKLSSFGLWSFRHGWLCCFIGSSWAVNEYFGLINKLVKADLTNRLLPIIKGNSFLPNAVITLRSNPLCLHKLSLACVICWLLFQYAVVHFTQTQFGEGDLGITAS